MTIEQNKSLKEFTTFRIGGNAQFFCSVKNENELAEALTFSKEKKLPFFILGGGSNILISDKSFAGLVIKMEMKGTEFIPDENGNMRVTVAAGENWDDIVGKCVKKGFYGLETLSLIPGTVGAAPVQNIGAYGAEVKDTIDVVRAFDVTAGKFVTVSNVDCHFEYRDSIFKKNPGKWIITSVTFILKTAAQPVTEYKDVKDYFSKKGIEKPTLEEVREAVIFIRTNKLPDVTKIGTAGSFFKNPFVSHAKAHELKALYPDMPLFPVDDKQVKVPLGWILDHICDYKGISKGNVGTYKNQALVLVNNGNATAEEIKSFAQELIDVVKEKTGVDVEPEVQYVG